MQGIDLACLTHFFCAQMIVKLSTKYDIAQANIGVH